MARALFRYIVKDEGGNVIANAAVNLYRPTTTTAVYGTMYDAEVSGSTITNPVLSNQQGEVIAWLDTAQVVDVNVTSNSSAAYYPKNVSAKLSFASFTEGPIPVVPGSASSVAGSASPSAFNIENHDTARHTFTTQGDNGDGNGMRTWLSLENSNPGPNDLNLRNVVINAGSTDTAVQKHLAVPMNFTSPAAATGQYLRMWAPGVTTASPSCFAVSVTGSLTLAVGGLTGNAIFVKVAADSQSRFVVDEFGAMTWGPGGSTAVDTALSRSAANVLSLGSDDAIKTGASTHASLPSPAGYAAGAQFYCTTDKKPVWSDGSTHWVDAAGANHT